MTEGPHASGGVEISDPWVKTSSFASPESARSGAQAPFRWLAWTTAAVGFAVVLGMLFVYKMPYLRNYTRSAGVILGLMAVVLYIREKLKVPVEIFIFAAFIGWASLAGLLGSVRIEATLDHLLTLSQSLVLLFGLVGIVLANKDQKAILMIILVGDVLLLGYGVYTGDIFDIREHTARERFSSFVKNPNAMSYLMLYGLVSVNILYRSGMSFLKKAILVSLTIGFLYGVVASGSRKSFIALFVYYAALFVFNYADKVFKRYGTAFFIVGFAAALSLYAVWAYRSTPMGSRLQASMQSENVSSIRATLYSEAMNVFAEKPFIGVGLGGFRYLSASGHYAHSDYAELLAATGILGLALYLSIYLVIFGRCRYIRRYSEDANAVYNSGVMMSAIVMMLWISAGTANIFNTMHWVFLAGFIGATAVYVKAVRGVRGQRALRGVVER